MEMVLKTQRLCKSYKNTPVLNGIDFEAKKGELIGLLGGNGAGKTTLLKLLAGLLEPTEGSVELFGHSPWHARNKVLGKLGVMIETPVFYEHLTAQENIQIHLDYMGKTADIGAILHTVGLHHAGKKPVSAFSMGMKQRLGIARAISHEPNVLLLDEPINGLDPIAIKEMRELFISLKEKGTTIVLSSHILAEILQTAESVVVVSNSHLQQLGKIEDLQNKVGDEIENYLIERMRG